MVQIRHRSFVSALAAPLSLMLALGCQAKKEPEPTAPSTGTLATGQAPDGPCPELVQKLCEKAGDKSELCGAGRALGDVLPANACKAAVADFASVGQRIDAERKVCSDLIERICADVGPSTDTCQMVRDQTPSFPKERCVALTAQYDEVIKELKQQEAANQPLPPDVQAKLAAGNAPSFGPADAKVTLVEFSDFQCPYCSRAAEVVHKVRERFGDRVRFVFRQFPLDFHREAHLAAQAALAAHQQGKFWEYHDLLFKNQNALTRDALEKYGQDLKLDLASLKQALDASTYKAAVDADLKLGQEVSVNGTPTLFINGKRVSNPSDFEAVARSIEAALGA